jgi:hypothetical protein
LEKRDPIWEKYVEEPHDRLRRKLDSVRFGANPTHDPADADDSRPSHVSPDTEAFVARITGRPAPMDTAAFVAAITGADGPATDLDTRHLDENNYNPNEPSDELGRWTADGSEYRRTRASRGLLHAMARAKGGHGQSEEDKADAAFDSTNKRFPIYNRGIDSRDMSTLDAGTRELVEGRNRALVKSGVLAGHVPAVNIGGETDGELGVRGAINVNVTNRGTGFNNDKPIPRLYMREGTDAHLPFGDRTVDGVVSRGTPIDAATANEIARVIAPGGTVTLAGPVTESDSTMNARMRVVKAIGARGHATQGYHHENGVTMLTTTIAVDK